MMKSFKEFLEEKVSDSSKRNYEYTHNKKPRGKGHWVFSANGIQIGVEGSFSEAQRKARKHFRSMGHTGDIHVET